MKECPGDHEIVDVMLTLGGNFIRHLALMFIAADLVNQQRIKAAFAEEWGQYAELAGLRSTREQAAPKVVGG